MNKLINSSPFKKVFRLYVKFKLRFRLMLFNHIIYHAIFSTKIIDLPNQLIYNLKLFPPNIGDFIHILSIAQALSLKFHERSLNKVIFIYDCKDEWHLFFIKNVAKQIIFILDRNIIFEFFSYEYCKNNNIGNSIFPYIPTFYNCKYEYRPYKSQDSLVLAKILDLRVFNDISLNEFKQEKYKEIYQTLNQLTQKKFYCFVMRESNPLKRKVNKRFYCEKEWDPTHTIKIINFLIKKGIKVVVINPLDQKYDIPGAVVINIASVDPLVRYFLYVRAYKVVSVEGGLAAILYHSKLARYIIYNTNIYFNSTNKMLEKELFYKNIDWVLDSSDRQSIFGNLSIDDL